MLLPVPATRRSRDVVESDAAAGGRGAARRPTARRHAAREAALTGLADTPRVGDEVSCQQAGRWFAASVQAVWLCAQPARAVRPAEARTPPTRAELVAAELGQSGGARRRGRFRGKQVPPRLAEACVALGLRGCVRVHYRGWSHSQDEWVVLDSARLRPAA